MPYTTRPRRNTPVRTLIKNFTDKKSGKVSEARRELIRRFNYLDWKDQKRLIPIFLDSGKTDRDWIYPKLLNLWDKSFEKQVRERWEELHEYKCSWAVIRHLPETYVMEHIDELKGGRNYFFICMRLGHRKDFTIDKTQLSWNDFLLALQNSGKGISKETAHEAIYNIVYEICESELGSKRKCCDAIFSSYNGYIFTPYLYNEVAQALSTLLESGHADVVKEFGQWDETLKPIIYNSEEFQATLNLPQEQQVYVEHLQKQIACKYTYLALDKQYQQSSDPELQKILSSTEWIWEEIKESKHQEEICDFDEFDEDCDIPF